MSKVLLLNISCICLAVLAIIFFVPFIFASSTSQNVECKQSDVATISGNKLAIPSNPIEILLDNDTMEYDITGEYNFAPYYMDDTEKIYDVEYTLPQISEIGNYYLHIEDIPGYSISNSDIEIHITVKEITATYLNTEVEYSGGPQTVVGTTEYDYITILVSGGTNTYPNSYPFTATMLVNGENNPNFILTNPTGTMIISRATIDESSYTVNDVTVRYLDDISNLDSLGIVSGEWGVVEWRLSRVDSTASTVGQYTIEVAFDIIKSERPYYNALSGEFSVQYATLTILPKILSVSNFTFANAVITYDGQGHNNLVEFPYGSVRYDVTDKDANVVCTNATTYSLVNVNIYDITVNFSVTNANYELDEYEFTRTISIIPADYNTTLLPQYLDEYVVYDSGEHRYDLTPYLLPDGVTISTTGYAYYVNAGEYPLVISYDLGNNYNPIDSVNVTLYITPKPITAELDVDTFNYNSSTHTVSAHPVGMCDGDNGEILLIDNSATNAGTYSAIVSGIDNPNYIVNTESLTFTINPIYPNLNSLTFSNNTFEYDGERHFPSFSINLPDGVTAQFISNEDCVHVGRHQVYLFFTSNNPNYIAPFMMYAYTIITPRPVSVVFGNTVFVYTGFSKSVDYTIVGVLDGDTLDSNIEYSATPIMPGDYTAIVTLNNDDYVISGDDTTLLTILATHKEVLTDEFQMDIKGDSFRIDTDINVAIADANYLDYFNRGRCIQCIKLSINMDLDGEYELSIPSNGKITNLKNISVYRINLDGSVTKLSKELWGDKLHIMVSNGDEILLVENSEDILLNIILVFISVIICTIYVSIPFIWERRKLAKASSK